MAQEEKLGKIDIADLEMTVYERDSSASALVLFDVGKVDFRYSNNKGFMLAFSRHRRVKIFTKDGYNEANVSIYFQDPGYFDEKVIGLKGFTYVLENGNVEKYKLEKSSIFDEEVTDELRVKKFTMPNVSEGCVIDYEYTINSDFISTIRPWYFQEDIPILYNEYSVSIPEYFNYQKVSQGYLKFDDYKQADKSEQITWTTSNRGNNKYAQQTSYDNHKVDFKSYMEKWTIKHTPAFKDEDYITTAEDYISKVEYQLAATNFPGEGVKSVWGTWESVNDRLLKNQGFGGLLSKKNQLKELTQAIEANTTTDEEKLLAAFQFVNTQIKYDGRKRFTSDQSFKDILSSKTGSSAGMNLMLVAMLQNLGLDANPVILSTRDNGRVSHIYPIISKFNYVIAHVMIGEKTLLLDATAKNLPFGMLPKHCLNGAGRIISETNPDWVNLHAKGWDSRMVNTELNILESGSVTGKTYINEFDYQGALTRSKVSVNSQEEYFSNVWERNAIGFAIQNFAMENIENVASPLKTIFDIELENAVMGNLVYLNPIMISKFKDNPFKQETREYPVDFGCPIKEVYAFTVQVPEDYEVDEMPESTVVALPENGGRFLYNASQIGDKILVNCQIVLNKPLFLPAEYPYLKEFFDLVVAKQNEQLVLKKKS